MKDIVNTYIKVCIKTGISLLFFLTVNSPSVSAQRNFPAPVTDEAPDDVQAGKPLLAVKTNLLFDVFSAVNLEIEVPIGQRWSVLGECIFPWWIWEQKQSCLQLVNVNAEGRYWFNRLSGGPVMTGWFAGLYAGGGYYDFEWKNKGYQGEFYMSAGLTGGYAHTLGKDSNFRMEYSVGIGYLNTRYREYSSVWGVDDEWHLVLRQSGNYSWVGPTRLKVSLVWMLNY